MNRARRRILSTMAIVSLILFIFPDISTTVTKPKPGTSQTRTRIRLGLPGMRWFTFDSNVIEESQTVVAHQLQADPKAEPKELRGSVTVSNTRFSHDFHISFISISWLFLTGAIVLLILRARLPELPRPGGVDQQAPAEATS